MQVAQTAFASAIFFREYRSPGSKINKVNSMPLQAA
jgi:hypothetical protein